MSIYLGDSGQVAIRRIGVGAGVLSSALDPEDVNVQNKRFSFDFPFSSLITGDRLRISTTDGSNLQLVSGHNFPDGAWYININPVGGVRLYTEYGDAINGTTSRALTLIAPSSTQQIVANTLSNTDQCVAQIKSYDFTTSREQVDLTSLGEEHRRSYEAGLISGQGNLRCLWDYKQQLCDPMQPETQLEEPQYFAELILRMKLGAQFGAQLYINRSITEHSLWWECECIVTSVAFNFSPAALLETQINFVTTGPIAMKSGYVERFLLQEDDSFIDLESSQEGVIALEEPD